MKKLLLLSISTILFGCLAFISISAAPLADQLPDTLKTLTNTTVFKFDEFADLLKSAGELYGQKKYDEAIAVCLKASELNPKDSRPYAIAGIIYSAQWKLKSASESFAKAISLNPSNKRLYILKARADQYRGAKDDALAECRKVLEIDPNFAEAYVMIGDTIRYDEKRRDEAIAAYRSAIKADPRVLTAYEGLGQLLSDSKDEKGAEEIFRQGIAADPKKMSGRFDLGRMLVKQDRLKEAREIWEGRTADEDRTFPNFITLLERAEKFKKVSDALAEKPNDPDRLVEMGNAVMEGESWVVDKRQERAIEYFRKALKVKPDLIAAQAGICKAYIQLADTFDDKKKNADEELAKLKQLDPKLAKEMEEYRKTYKGGLQASPTNFNQ